MRIDPETGIDLDDNDMRPPWEDYNELEGDYRLLRAVTTELMRAAQLVMEHNCAAENENFNEPCPVGERLRAAIRLAKEILPCS
jgi:hypothetical protein